MKKAPEGELTYLESAEGKLACKKLNSDMEVISSYGLGEYYYFYKVKFHGWYGMDGQLGLLTILDTLHKSRCHFPVSGQADDSVLDGDSHRRLKNTDPKTGEKPTLLALPTNVMFLDIDGFLTTGVDPIKNPGACAVKVIEKLGSDFLNVKCWYCFTSSQQVKPDVKGNIKLRMRFVFLLANFVELDQLKIWASQSKYQELILDGSISSSNQPIYLAAPKVEGGKDPIGKRNWFLDGENDYVNLVVPQYQDQSDSCISSPLSQKMTRTGLVLNDAELQLDTVLDTEIGHMAVKDFWLSTEQKLRVQAPYRPESESWAAFIGRHQNDVPFVHDIGNQVKYLIKDAVIELAKCIEFDDIQTLIKAVAYESEFNKQRVKNILKKRGVVDKGDFNNLLTEHNEKEFSDYQVMTSLLESFGADNVIFSEDRLWNWNDKGVWESWPEEFFDQTVILHPLCNKYGEKLAKSGFINSLRLLIKKETAIKGTMQPYQSFKFINCMNGELHWNGSDWDLRGHDKSNLSTNQCNFKYLKNLECSRWDQFLREIFENTADENGILAQIELLQALMGYSMTSDTSFEKFVVLQGPGGNGKSVLLFLMQYMIGQDNVSSVQPDKLDDKFQQGFMDKKLVNIVTEVSLDDVLPDKKIKAIASGESVTVEHKYQKPFNTNLFTTLWFASNPVPAVRDYSDAFFERAVFFKLPNTFRDTENQEIDLLQKLKSESSGIAFKCLESYGRVLKRGHFIIPEVVKANIDEWRVETDHVRIFVDENLILDPESSVTQHDLYSKYEYWASSNGIRYRLKLRTLVKRIVHAFKLETGYASGRVAILMGVRFI